MTTNLVRRLQHELKSHFNLKREVSKDDKRLRWDLSDFLRLASDKAASSLILIVIDGIHLLKDEEGEEDLKWLPQIYPRNVRLIVSTTIHETTIQRQNDSANYYGDPESIMDGGESLSMPSEEGRRVISNLIEKEESGLYSARGTKNTPVILDSVYNGNKTFNELCRRGWDTLRVEHMPLPICQEMMSSCVTSPLTGDNPPASLSGFGADRTFKLFPSQCRNILASPLSRNPQFLRLLLHALRWSARQNFDIWQIIPAWTGSTSVVELYERILSTWENGLPVTETSRKEALQSVAKEQKRDKADSSRNNIVDFSRPNASPHHFGENSSFLRSRYIGKGADMPSELPLAEMQWRKVHSDADKAIEDARCAVQHAAAQAIAETVITANENAEQIPKEITDPAQAVIQMIPFNNQQALGSGGSHSAAGTGNKESAFIKPFGSLSTPQSILEGLWKEDKDKKERAGEKTTPNRHPGLPYQGDARRNYGSTDITFVEPSNIPSYLCGGESFEGFGALIGNALAALYVARHGLTVSELLHLLNDMQKQDDYNFCVLLSKRKDTILQMCQKADSESTGFLEYKAFEGLLLDCTTDISSVKRQSFFGFFKRAVRGLHMQNHVQYHDILSFCDCTAAQSIHEKSSEETLSSIVDCTKGAQDGHMRERLLDVLTILGILVPKRDHLLVLMLESENLRQMVRCRYIDHQDNIPRGQLGIVRSVSIETALEHRVVSSGEATWHQAIIKHFQSQPSSLLRRCKELPWHLHVCQEWKALKSFLVELEAFKMMFNGGLKHELFSYWRLLTEGPLWLPQDSSQGSNHANASVKGEDGKQPPAIPCEEIVHLRSEGRKKMPTFDIVECYNQSVERMKAKTTTLSSQLLSEVLWLVGRFLADFAESVAVHNPFPRYLRKPLDLALTEMIGVDKKEDESLASRLFLQPLPPPLPRIPKSESDDEDNSSDDDDEKTPGGSDHLKDAEDQLKKLEDDIPLGNEEEDDEDERDQALQRRHRQLEMMRSRAVLVAMDSAYYHFKRWFWIQFPWIALANVELALRQYLEESGDLRDCSSRTSRPLPTVSNQDDDEHLPSEQTPHNSDLSPKAMLPIQQVRSVGATRAWIINKQNPGMTIAQTTESIQFRTMVRSSTLHLAPHTASSHRHIEAIFHDDGNLTMPTETSNNFEDTGEADNAYCQDCKKGDCACDDGAVNKSVSAVSGSCGLVVTHREKQLQDSNLRVARLRRVLDQVTTEKNSMEALLTTLNRQAVARDHQDGQALREMATGEFILQALLTRLSRLSEALTEAIALGRYYKKIIDQCVIKNPVKDPQRLDALDNQVALATSQCESLHHHRNLLRREKERLETEEFKNIQHNVEYLVAKRKEVQDRIAKVHQHRIRRASHATNHGRTLRHAMAFLGRGLRQKGVQGHVYQRGYRAYGLYSSMVLSPPSSLHGVVTADTKQDPPKLTAFQSIFAAKRSERIRLGMEKLFEMSGVNTIQSASQDQSSVSNSKTERSVVPDTERAASCVISMFKRVHKLNKSFENEAAYLETQISSLRAQLQMEENKLADSTLDLTAASPSTKVSGSSLLKFTLQVASGTSQVSPSPDSIASIIQRERNRCAKYQYLSAGAHEILDQVKIGVNHLARLVAAHCISLPLATLRSVDGDIVDQYENSELYQVFSLFDERITSIHEIVALDTNEKADSAIKSFGSTPIKADRGKGINVTGWNGQMRSYHDLSGIVEDNLSGATSQADHTASVRKASSGNDAATEEDLLGIDIEKVIHMKGEVARTQKSSLQMTAYPSLSDVSYRSSHLSDHAILPRNVVGFRRKRVQHTGKSKIKPSNWTVMHRL